MIIAQMIILALVAGGMVWLAWKYAAAKQRLDQQYRDWRLNKIRKQRDSDPDPDTSWQRFLDEREIARAR